MSAGALQDQSHQIPLELKEVMKCLVGRLGVELRSDATVYALLTTEQIISS